MLKRIDNYRVEILISLALVTAGYAWADRLHLSAAITAVIVTAAARSLRNSPADWLNAKELAAVRTRRISAASGSRLPRDPRWQG